MEAGWCNPGMAHSSCQGMQAGEAVVQSLYVYLDKHPPSQELAKQSLVRAVFGPVNRPTESIGVC
jgi:hypothetical protein